MSESREPRTIEPDDLFRLKFLQGAQLSPDGKTIVYAVSHVESDEAGRDGGDGGEAEGKEFVTLWLLSLGTGAVRQLTAGLARDWSPQWSPDGKRIAFLSTRGGPPQIYLIPVDGGEAQALTAMKQGVGGGPAWSPDGKRIAFTAGPANPPQPGKPYRVTRPVYRIDGMGYLHGALHDIYVISAAGGEPRRLTDDDWHNSGPQWSPDGREILFSTTMAPDSNVLCARLKVVDLEGQIRDITGDWGNARSATWTPDGKRIVFVGAPHGRAGGSKDDLWLIRRQGNEPECRTEGLKFGVGGRLQPDVPALLGNLSAPTILLTKDGLMAYIRVQDGGAMPIYRVSLAGTESWTPVVTGQRSSFALGLDGEHLLYGVSTVHNPADLFIAGVDGTDERQLTHLNAELLTDRRLPTVERLLYPSTDRAQVEGWILKPCVSQAPHPTILYIHGGRPMGCGHIFSFDAQMLAAAGYAVLLLNYRGSSGYGDSFATQVNGDYGTLEYQDLMAGVDTAVEQGLADPCRLGCCGLSWGGFLSCWIAGHTDRFKAVVPENPVTDWTSMYGVSDTGLSSYLHFGGLPHEIPEVYRRCSPITYAHRCTTPTLLIRGEADLRCPAEQSEKFYATLKSSGCVVEMLRLPGSPHLGSIIGEPSVRRAQNEALLEWMNRYVLGIDPDEEATE